MEFRKRQLSRRLGLLNDEQIKLLCMSKNSGGYHENEYNMIYPFLPDKIKRSNQEDLDLWDKKGWINKRVLDFTGYDPHPMVSRGLSSYGYDMALSWQFVIFQKQPDDHIVDPKDPKSFITEMVKTDEKRRFIIPAGGYALGSSEECFYMPDDVLGLCLGKSTYARSGIDVNLTPLEPGWRGHLTLEIANHLPNKTAVYPGEGIAQVLFFRGGRPKKLYAKDGKYQDQGIYPTHSKV